jgi:hypothetical protein
MYRLLKDSFLLKKTHPATGMAVGYEPCWRSWSEEKCIETNCDKKNFLS